MYVRRILPPLTLSLLAIGLFTVSLLIGGCTLGPDFSRPAAPAGGYAHAAPAPSATRSISYGGDVAADWYRLYGSEQLEQLVRAALERNPSLEAARHGLKAAQYELQAVAGAALPQFDATGQVGRAHINGSFLYGPVNAIDQTGNRFELGPALAYNLDVFGGTRRAIESQQAATGVARDQVLNTYVTLVDQVVMTAFDYAASADCSCGASWRTAAAVVRLLRHAARGRRARDLRVPGVREHRHDDGHHADHRHPVAVHVVRRLGDHRVVHRGRPRRQRQHAPFS